MKDNQIIVPRNNLQAWNQWATNINGEFARLFGLATTIPVEYKPTAYRLEGTEWYCEHEDTYIDTETRMAINSLTGEYDDCEVAITVCSGCGAYSNGEEWYE